MMKYQLLLISLLITGCILAWSHDSAGADVTPSEIASKDDAEGEPPCVDLIRSVPTGTYTPGKTLSIVLRAEATCTGQITSFGISERIPLGWELTQVEDIMGSKPGHRFSEGLLEFIWVSVPVFPLEFQYTITPVNTSGETLEFSGNAFYYIGVENEMRTSETVVTLVESSPQREGETHGEGEGEGESEAEGEGGQEGETPPPSGCCRVVSTASALPKSNIRTVFLSGDGFLIALAGLSLYFSKL